jgi:hypothetical protein
VPRYPVLASAAAAKLLAEIAEWPLRCRAAGREWVAALCAGDHRAVAATAYRLVPLLRAAGDDSARATVVTISERYQAARAPHDLAQMLRRTFPDQMGDITGDEVTELGITGYEPPTSVDSLAARLTAARRSDLALSDTRPHPSDVPKEVTQ